jgi:hypothetical protein
VSAVAGAASTARTASKDGREVVSMHCVAEADSYSVECKVYPITGLRVEPLRPGPYRFATLDEANAFLDEASLCLKHLGCELG